WSGLFNLVVAAQLASLLLLFVAVMTTLEQRARSKAHYTQDERRKPGSAYRLRGLAACCASGLCTVVLLIAFVVPVSQLVLWVYAAGLNGLDARYFTFLRNTLGLGAVAAV